EIVTGDLLSLGNLTIIIYDSPSAGNLVYNQTFPDAIINGSWNLMIMPNLKFGNNYWKDYEINGENLDFDGNERIEFQSSLGLINDASYINFSLISPCPAGSSINLIYENGSVECETDDSGSFDLTNYALKNQSETFSEDVTAETGFFGFLGSLIQRITKLFVQDVEFTGIINGSGNIETSENVSAFYFIGNGSLLTDTPAGAESDPIFMAENSSLWEVINTRLEDTDQRYNETTLISGINTTLNIMSLDFYNKGEIDDLILGVSNSSWNQSLTDMLYYSISNPLNFINHTQAQDYNDTALILTTNSSLWGQINLNGPDWSSTFNETYDIWAYNQTTSSNYDYNHTLDVYDLWGVLWYNYTSDTYTLWNSAWTNTFNESYHGLIQNASYLDTFNETYNDYGYNHTIDTFILYNSTWDNTVDTAYLYNHTLDTYTLYDVRWTDTFNATYDAEIKGLIQNVSYLDTYNESYAGLIDNESYLECYNATYDSATTYNYNHTLDTYNLWGSFWYNHTADTNTLYNAIWSSTFNDTYNELILDNSSLYSTYNATYDQWAYNQTIPANLYTDTKVETANLHTHSILNITGTDDNSCTGTDKVSNVTFNNGNLQIVCAADQTGGGSGVSFTYFNRTTADVATTESVNYVDVIALPLTSGATVNIECILLQDAAAATTGVQYQSVLTGTSSQRQVMEYYSSATAQAICQGTGTTLTCSPAASSGTTITPNRLYIYSIQSGSGTFTLSLRSEVSGSAANVRAGSWCRSIET
ncbi:MAG: hypothetical protein Q8N88_06935, partial [Nanoarchaeota archaeon]|nr:hypothetical protein [Nanoarchaeota archaeon]